MVDTKSPGDKTLSVPTKTLTLKPRVETGTVRQSFSHGRTKQVVVEKRGKRRVGGDAPATETPHAPEPVVAGASPPTRRLPRFSTTTCLVRPWLKLCFTVPVSTRGLSVKVLFGTLSFLSPGALSTIQQSSSCCVVRVRTVCIGEFLATLPAVLSSSAIRY